MMPAQPRAFRDIDDIRAEKLKRLIWLLVFGTVLVLVSVFTRLIDRIRDTKLTELNNVRMFLFLLVVFIVMATYLLLNSTPTGDRADNMRTEHPYVAYPMTFVFLILIGLTFSIFTTLMAASGVLFFFSFWGFLINLLLLLA